jgi:hypothetical protein
MTWCRGLSSWTQLRRSKSFFAVRLDESSSSRFVVCSGEPAVEISKTTGLPALLVHTVPGESPKTAKRQDSENQFLIVGGMRRIARFVVSNS